MSSKLGVFLTAVALGMALLISGCGSSADLSLKLVPEQTGQYKVTTEQVKDFRFDQPNLGKLREEQTKSHFEMGFTQTIKNVDPNGIAVVNITIKDLKATIVNKNETTLAFNSAEEKDKNNPLAKLIGQSYTIQLTPAGQAKLLDAKDALAAVTAGYEKQVATSMFDPKSVAERHQILALPAEKATGLSVKDSWNQVVPSPPGLLTPKTFKKVYTLRKIDGNIATVDMAASESGESSEGVSAISSMGVFAKMFDNEDTFTGTMKLDINTGQVLLSEESLVSTYVAQEMPQNADPAKGPDTLTMRFSYRIHMEKQD